MTKQQQTDHQNWKLNQNQPLPTSLENVLIERCLEELNLSEIIRQRFNSNSEVTCYISISNNKLCFTDEFSDNFMELQTISQKEIIQALLSRTPDGQAVMPFLDVEIKTLDYANDLYWDGGYDDGANKVLSQIDELEPKTLDHQLHREFTEALRVGKTFDEAYKIINLIYCQNV